MKTNHTKLKSLFSLNNVEMDFATSNLANGMIKVRIGGRDNKMMTILKDNDILSGMQGGMAFLVTQQEMDVFERDVLNEGINWEVSNKNGETVKIPGMWMSRKSKSPIGSRKSKASAKSIGGRRKIRKSKKRRR